jgi:hypothetical protein
MAESTGKLPKKLVYEVSVCFTHSSYIEVLTAYTDRPERGENSNSSKIRTTSRDHTEDSCNANGEVESPSSAEDVTAETPKHGAEKEPDVLGQGEEGWANRIEFVADGCEDQGRDDRPEVVHRPAEADHDEELR